MLPRRISSVCPVCLRKIPADLRARDEAQKGTVYLEKTCPDCGSFAVPVWRGRLDLSEWIAREEPLTEEAEASCGGNCLLCGAHPQETCCALLEVTRRCDLRCTFCFANGGEAGGDPSFDALRSAVDDIVRLAGAPLLQFSGGEPTLRDDLPALIRYAKEAGCSYTQVNTNGIRLAEDPAYVRRLKEAGLDIVFLQFDGTDDEVFRILRGRPLFAVKKRAVENCAMCGLGVTLVPTVVRGVNDEKLGEIVRFAAAHHPAVRGVHFQPVTYLGRIPGLPGGADRYTLDELIADLAEETGLPSDAFLPSRCDHALCGFHATFLVTKDRLLYAATSRRADSREGRTSAAVNRTFIGDHWRGTGAPLSLPPRAGGDMSSAHAHTEGCMPSAAGSGTASEAAVREDGEGNSPRLRLAADRMEEMDFDGFIRAMRQGTLVLSAMVFQDAMNLNLERLSRCSLHVYKEGKLIPFCAAYLTPLGAGERIGSPDAGPGATAQQVPDARPASKEVPPCD